MIIGKTVIHEYPLLYEYLLCSLELWRPLMCTNFQGNQIMCLLLWQFCKYARKREKEEGKMKLRLIFLKLMSQEFMERLL